MTAATLTQSAAQRRYLRKVIWICAEDSPNVRLARAQLTAGKEPTDEVLVPGVLTWGEYQARRRTWDAARQSVGLDAKWYEGPSLKLFPPAWRKAAADRAIALRALGKQRQGGPKTLGVDPAEGGDSSSFAVSDRLGLIVLESIKTPDTTVVPGHVLNLMARYDIDAENVLFDRGGGGKEHMDRLRRMGHDVRSVSFGASPALEVKRGIQFFADKKEVREDKTVYKKLRDQLFAEMSMAIDPDGGGVGDVRLWAIPGPDEGEVYQKLGVQLGVFTKDYDAEGKLVLPPKNPQPGEDGGRKKTLVGMLGYSPDEADAAALSLHAILHPLSRSIAAVGG